MIYIEVSSWNDTFWSWCWETSARPPVFIDILPRATRYSECPRPSPFVKTGLNSLRTRCQVQTCLSIGAANRCCASRTTFLRLNLQPACRLQHWAESEVSHVAFENLDQEVHWMIHSLNCLKLHAWVGASKSPWAWHDDPSWCWGGQVRRRYAQRSQETACLLLHTRCWCTRCDLRRFNRLKQTSCCEQAL